MNPSFQIIFFEECNAIKQTKNKFFCGEIEAKIRCAIGRTTAFNKVPF